MWILMSEVGQTGERWNLTSKTPKWALKTGEVYTVGKTRADIQPEGDSSVSGRHARISVILKDGAAIPEVLLEDVGSSYGTFVNDAIDSPAVGAQNFDRRKPGKGISKPIVLKDNDRIKFGALTFVLRLKWIQLNVITSMLKNFIEVNSLLRKISKSEVQSRWTEKTTHLVMANIQLSPKVLTCLVRQVPVVTVNYFRDFLSAMKTKQRLPDTDNYIPPISETESQLREPDVCLTTDERRRTLFQGKEFIFLDEGQPDLERVLPMAGATVTHQSPGFKDPKLDSDDVIVVKPKRSPRTESQSLELATYQYLKSVGRTMVPPNSIFMSIVRSDPQVCSNQKQHRFPSSLLSNTSSSSMGSQHYQIRAKETLDMSSQKDCSIPLISGSRRENRILTGGGNVNKETLSSTVSVIPPTNQNMATNRLTETFETGRSMLPPTPADVQTSNEKTAVHASTNKRSAVQPSSIQRSGVQVAANQMKAPQVPAAAIPSTHQREAAVPSTNQRAAAVPSTNQREAAVPSTNQREAAVPSTNQRAAVVSSTNQRAATNRQPNKKAPIASAEEVRTNQKKRMLSADSDTEDQENKKPHLDTNQQTTPLPPADKTAETRRPEVSSDNWLSSAKNRKQQQHATSTQLQTSVGVSRQVPDKDDLFDDEDDDLFGFGGEDELPSKVSMATTATSRSSTTSSTNSVFAITQKNKGDGVSQTFPSVSTGVSAHCSSVSKKRKSSWGHKQEDEDVFGFDSDDQDDNKKDSAFSTQSNKRLKQRCSSEEDDQLFNDRDEEFDDETVEAKFCMKEEGVDLSVQSVQSTSVNTTAGFLSKSKVKHEAEDNMSHLAEEFCTIRVSNLIQRSPVKSARYKVVADPVSVVSSKHNLTSSPLSQGKKQFHKQDLRLSQGKVALTKKITGDEEDRSIAEWFKQNPDVTIAIQKEQKEKADAEELWNFSQSRNKQTSLSARFK